MKLENKNLIVRGEHNGIKFRYDDQELIIFGHSYNRKQIQVLVEVANLLEHEGLKIREGDVKENQGSSVIWPRLMGRAYFDEPEEE